MIAPLHPSEKQRLSELRSLKILDTSQDEIFDRIASLAAYIYEAPMASITFVDEHRQWFKACIGLQNRESSRDHSLCAHAILESDSMVVGDAHEDPRFKDNLLVTGPPFIRFYAGSLIISASGMPLGTICVMARVARDPVLFDQKPLRELGQVIASLVYNYRPAHRAACVMY